MRKSRVTIGRSKEHVVKLNIRMSDEAIKRLKELEDWEKRSRARMKDILVD